MTPTLMMALPLKKIDICTMILFQGELAASTEVSLTPDAQKGPLSAPHYTYSPYPPLHFTALASGQCDSPALSPCNASPGFRSRCLI